MREIKSIVIHCTDSPNPAQTVEDVRRWHIAKGWNDIGYHWLICMDGLLQRGRDEALVGAHCKGHNLDSIGIALAGRDNFKPEQFDTLRALLRVKKILHPYARLFAHNELDKQGKTCPNFDVEQLRRYWIWLPT